jgi:calcineurin-like phosphoesterase family protein
MAEFVISDTHWGDERVIGFTDRPFSDVDHETMVMIELWNSVVSPGDTVFHLGDVVARVEDPVSYAHDILSQLNGYKILTPGNYEENLSDSEMIEAGFDEVHFYLEYRGFFLIHKPRDGVELNTNGLPMLHGHKHIETPIYTDYWGLNMSCEYWDYRPVSFEEIEERFAFWAVEGYKDAMFTPPSW